MTTLHSNNNNDNDNVNLQAKFNSQNSKNSEDFFTKKTTFQKPTN